MPQALDNDLKNLIHLVGNVTDAFTAALFLLDTSGTDTLKLKIFQSLSNNIIQNAKIPIGAGLIGWVAKNEKPTHATNFDRDTTTLKFYSKDEQIKSFAAAPVFVDGQVVGVLSIDSKSQYLFTDKMMKILSNFAEAAAGVISQGEKRIKLDSEAVAFEALADIVGRVMACEKLSELVSMLRLNMGNLIQHDLLALAVRSHEEDKFQLIYASGASVGKVGAMALPLTHYRLGWVIGQGRPIYITDLQGAQAIPGDKSKWKSFMGAPMVAHENVMGAIGLLSRKPKAFRQVDTQSLSILAASLSSAFTSLYLHQKNKQADFLDPVTQMVSRQYFLENHGGLEEEGAVVIVNLIGFHKVNLELGWKGGNHILMEAAQRLEQVVGDKGIVCRDYADKFILLLKNISKEKTLQLVESASAALESEPFLYGGYEILISSCFGVTLYPGEGSDIETLLQNARTAARNARGQAGVRLSLFNDPDSDWSAHLKSIKK